MTRALFITTATTEPKEQVKAWANTMGPSAHIPYELNVSRELWPNDETILDAARFWEPDVIFYTGATGGLGTPSEDTLRELRQIALSIQIQGDMADPPWWDTLARYKKGGCFDLQVAMDGVHGSPADHVTLTPLDPAAYQYSPRHEVRPHACGFSGNLPSRERWEFILKEHGTEDPRSAVVHRLPVVVRPREVHGPYDHYVDFHRHCRMVINTSLAGSGACHHIKGRVLEAAFAGCALLEMHGSPIADWFPEGSYYMYSTVEEAKAIIENTSQLEVKHVAKIFRAYALEHYHAEILFKRMLPKT